MSEEKKSLASRFLHACLAVTVGIVLLSIALQFLARIWVWLLVIALVVAGIWTAVRLVRARRDRW